MRFFYLISLCTFSSYTYSEGIALGATRLIYPSDSKQISLPIINSSESKRYLIQSWIEDESEKKVKNFVVTPPLFVSKPKSENSIKIRYLGDTLPTDKETVFWLNSKAIPAVDEKTLENNNVLQIAILSRIKVFMRPINLPISFDEAVKQVEFTRENNSLKISNPSPYYITFSSIKIGKKDLDNKMISPKSTIYLNIPTNTTEKELSYQVVNDYGTYTQAIKKTIKLNNR